MSLNIKILYTILFGLVFLILPIVFFFLGDFPSRTILKTSISIITIAAFFILIAQFFLSNINISLVFKMFKVVKIHKVLGYIVLAIFLIHPFLIVVPRFFEVGPSPFESFFKMVLAFDNLGVILGIVAWILMFILGFTSFFRDKLNIKYKHWKYLHGGLSILFILIAAWHAIDLGRHMSSLMITLIVVLTLFASFLLIKKYFFSTKNKEIKVKTNE